MNRHPCDNLDIFLVFLPICRKRTAFTRTSCEFINKFHIIHVWRWLLFSITEHCFRNRCSTAFPESCCFGWYWSFYLWLNNIEGIGKDRFKPLILREGMLTIWMPPSRCWLIPIRCLFFVGFTCIDKVSSFGTRIIIIIIDCSSKRMIVGIVMSGQGTRVDRRRLRFGHDNIV